MCYEELLILFHKNRFMRRRDRTVAFLLMPVAVFLWCFGWSLYWIESKRKTIAPKQSVRKRGASNFASWSEPKKLEV